MSIYFPKTWQYLPVVYLGCEYFYCFYSPWGH